MTTTDHSESSILDNSPVMYCIRHINGGGVELRQVADPSPKVFGSGGSRQRSNMSGYWDTEL